MTKTIGIIGAGMIGSQVARLSLDAGFKVVISNSRGPESLQSLIAELGKNAQAVTTDEAIAKGDIVVLAIPFGIYNELNPEQYQGKIIIDTMNYYPQRDGVMTEVQTLTIASSEMVQEHLRGSKLVKAINNMDFISLYKSARPSGANDRSALPIASNDVEAKNIVENFIEQIGYDTIDMGTLKDSWKSEPTMPIYVRPYANSRKVDKNEAVELLKNAVRHNQMHGSY